MALASTSVVPEADSDIERWRRKTLMLVIFVVGTAGPEEVDCDAALGPGAVTDAADTDAPEGSMDYRSIFALGAFRILESFEHRRFTPL